MNFCTAHYTQTLDICTNCYHVFF